MRLFGLNVLSDERLLSMKLNHESIGENKGFRQAVESLVIAIQAGDKVVLGNGTAFVGASYSGPITMVGNGGMLVNNLVGQLSKGNKDKYSPVIKYARSLKED